MSYPTSLDTLTTGIGANNDKLSSPNHVDQHTAESTAIQALEAKVGIDGSAVTTSHDYKLSGVTGSDKAVSKTGTETLTNKTLTSPKITVGSDAVGDLQYTSNVDGTQARLGIGTDGKILKVVSGLPSWQTETVTVDASTTVKGIVELATSAEITAGTATGGTGAVLVVTPDALAASTPVFNGSGLTNIPKRIGTTTTDVVVSNTTTETNLFSQSISGGVLSTSNYIRAVFYISQLQTISTSDTCTFRIKYGSTTLSSHTFNGAGAAGSVWLGRLEVILAGAGTTGTQNAISTYSLSPSYIGNGNIVGATFSSTTQGTSSEDSTTSKTFAVTAQFSAASASNNITVALITVESVA